MNGNSGHFTQFIIDGCKSVVIRNSAFHGEFKLNVTNVESVKLFPNAFTDSEYIAQFMMVQDLRIDEGAFSGAKVDSRLIVMDSKLDNWWPLRVAMKEILFVNTRINRITEKAFNSERIISIGFVDCHIGVIQEKAFTDK